MIKPILTTAILLTAVSAQAGRYTSFHGEGLPTKVEVKQEAKEYRANFMNEMGITAYKDNLGLTQFKGNDIGFSMLKMSNESEGTFKTILNKASQSSTARWGNGKGFITSLKIYTKRYGCIPKITSVSHGWGSEGRPGEGKALSGPNGVGGNGVYAYERDIPRDWLSRFTAVSLEKDLKRAVQDGSVQFCNSCVAQFFACNIAIDFAKVFTQISGCQTVAATGQNSPVFQNKEKTYEGKQRVYEGAHYWGSFAAIWEENSKSKQAKAAGQERPASWYRSTPIKNDDGQVIDIVEENLGKVYISL